MAHELAWKRRNHEKKVLKRNLIFNKVELQEPLISSTINYGVEKQCPLLIHLESHKQQHNDIIRLKKSLLKIIASLIRSDDYSTYAFSSIKKLLNDVKEWKSTIRGSFFITSMLFMLSDFYKYEIMNLPRDNRFVDYFDSFTLDSSLLVRILQHCELCEDFVNVVSLYEEDVINMILLRFMNIETDSTMLVESFFKKFLNLNYSDQIIMNILNEVMTRKKNYNPNVILPYSIEYLLSIDNTNKISNITLLEDENPLSHEFLKFNEFYNDNISNILPKVVDIIHQYIDDQLQLHTDTISSKLIDGSIFKLHITLRNNCLLNIESRDTLVNKVNLYLSKFITSKIKPINLKEEINGLEEDMVMDIDEEEIDIQIEQPSKESVSIELTKIFNQLIDTEDSINEYDRLLEISSSFPSLVLEKILDEAIKNRDHQEMMVATLNKLHPLAYIRNGSYECTLFIQLLAEKVSLISSFSSTMRDNFIIFISLCLKNNQNRDFPHTLSLVDPLELLEYFIIPNISLEYKNNEISIILDVLNLIIDNCFYDWILYANIALLITNISRLYSSFNRYSLENQNFSIECLDKMKNQVKWIVTSLSLNTSLSQRKIIFNDIVFSDWHIQYITLKNMFNEEEIDNNIYISLFPTTLHIFFDNQYKHMKIKPISWIQFIELCSLDGRHAQSHIEKNQFITSNDQDLRNGIIFTLPYLTKDEFMNITTVFLPILLQNNLLSINSTINYIDLVPEENKNYIHILYTIYEAFKRILKKKRDNSPRLISCFHNLIKNYILLLKRIYYELNLSIIPKIVSIDISADIMISINELADGDIIEPLYILIMDFFDRHAIEYSTLSQTERDALSEILKNIIRKLSKHDNRLFAILIKRIESFLNT